MDVFYEQPMLILVGGIVLLIVALAALVNTGKAGFLYAAGGAILLTGLLLFVERQVVTPREEIRGVLDDISAELVADNIPAVLNYISPSSEDMRRKAERLLKTVRVTRVSIKNNLEVKLKEGREGDNRDCVIATFNAVGTVSERKGSLKDQPSPQFFTVEFVRAGDGWQVKSYSRQPPHKGLR